MKILFAGVAAVMLLGLSSCDWRDNAMEHSAVVATALALPTPEPTAATTASPSPTAEPTPEPTSESRSIDEIFEVDGLIELIELDPSFVIDCKYATEDNFTGAVLYEMPLALVQKDVAVRLVEAQRIFRENGYSLKIFDLYRPLSIQQKLYDATPADLKMFVARPSKNAMHCKGVAVDCSLVNSEGNEIPMTSQFDEFNESAYADYRRGTAEERKNRDYLIAVMERCGFSVYSKEWWHFVAPNGDSYETLDISFTEFTKLRNEFYGRAGE